MDNDRDLAVNDEAAEAAAAPKKAPRTRRKAALAVAARAKDAEDCARLLDMLGLHATGKRASDVA